MDAPSAENTYSVPKTQAPWLSHFRAPPCQLIPLPNLGTQHHRVKSQCVDVIGQILSEKVCLSVEDLLALAPEVRRHFKEATTMKRLPALPVKAQSKAAHHVATFSMDKYHKHFLAEPALPLQKIEVTLDQHGYGHGIIDIGFQVIIICKDIWERLDANETRASYVHGVS